MNLMKSLLASTVLLIAVPEIAQADILVGFVTGLSGPVSSIGIPNGKGLRRAKPISARSVARSFA